MKRSQGSAKFYIPDTASSIRREKRERASKPANTDGTTPPPTTQPRKGARDGLESNERFQPRILFLVWEVLYQQSISTSHPSIPAPPVLFYFLVLLDALPLLFYNTHFVFLSETFSYVRVSPTDGWLWVVWGYVFGLFIL